MSGRARICSFLRARLGHWTAGVVVLLAGLVHTTAALASTAQYALTLEQLIKSPSMTIRGIEGRSGVEFGVRADQRIDKLTLDLALSSSPALIEKISHVNVLLNGRFVETLRLPAEPTDKPQRAQVDLPVADIQPFNVLELQLIGHYTLGCEDPLHEDLWIRIEPDSKLVFDVTRLALPDTLDMLPLPFFDKRDFQPQPATFVLGTPTNPRLEAAGIVASWLGALAGYRGTDFRVSTQKLPDQGHAIVILAPQEILPGIGLDAVQGPTLAMRSNPKDPAGKLLIITGRNDAEIRQAAVALALGTQTLSGSQALVSEVLLQARKPYDAPNWIATNRPVYLGELAPLNNLSVRGYDAELINIPLRLPPDLSTWEIQTAPLHIRYRYTPLLEDEHAKLTLLINQQYVAETILGDSNDGLWGKLTEIPGIAEHTMQLPLGLLESQAQLQLKFSYPEPIRAECSGAYLNPRMSSIDPDSTLDFSGFPHHIAMPDLAAFRNAAFPFSRLADLSETVVVLPEQTQRFEYQAFLTVLGKVGQSTGYPATGLTVQRQAADLENKDILIIDGGSSSPLLSQWSSYLPQANPAPGTVLGWSNHLTRLFSGNPFKSKPPFSAPSSGIYVAGFESPVSGGRSVVVIAGNNAADLPDNTQELLFNDKLAALVQGSLVTVRAGQIESLSNEKTYYVGSLGALQDILWLLSQYPILLLLIFLISAILIAVVLFLSLRARAEHRLLTGVSDASSPNHKE